MCFLKKISTRVWHTLTSCVFDLNSINNVHGHHTFNEKLLLYKLSKKTEGVFVEIGSYLGASSCFIAHGIKASCKFSKLYCIDTWKNDAMSEEKTDTFGDFLKNTHNYKDIIIPVREKSDKAVSRIQEEIDSIDFLFIDADHSYEGVFSDWSLYSPLLKSGSIVIFHDYGWSEGVKRVVEEKVKPLVSKEGNLPNMWWGYIK